MVAPAGISSGGQMLWQAALQPAGFVCRALPAPWVTSILPNPVRNASLTTNALAPVGPGPVWAATRYLVGGAVPGSPPGGTGRERPERPLLSG